MKQALILPKWPLIHTWRLSGAWIWTRWEWSCKKNIYTWLSETSNTLQFNYFMQWQNRIYLLSCNLLFTWLTRWTVDVSREVACQFFLAPQQTIRTVPYVFISFVALYVFWAIVRIGVEQYVLRWEWTKRIGGPSRYYIIKFCWLQYAMYKKKQQIYAIPKMYTEHI